MRIQMPAFENISALLRHLHIACQPTDVLEQSSLAALFASQEPNPFSFENPGLDTQSLENWARQNGFDVEMALDQTPDAEKNYPRVRFTKT
jgi:hypothetical protein